MPKTFYFSFTSTWSSFARGELEDHDLLPFDVFLVFNCVEKHVFPSGMVENPEIVPMEATWRNEVKHSSYESEVAISALDEDVKKKWLEFHSILLQKKRERKLICGIQNWKWEKTSRLQIVAEKKGWRNARMQHQGSLLWRLWSEKGHRCYTGYGHGSPFDPVRERALEAYYDGNGPHPDGEDRPGRIK